MSRTSGRSSVASRAAVAVGAVAVFLLLTARHLNTPGLYYDELHQAIASFDYIGRHYPSFNHEFHGVPILNMSYSGALKSNVYGVYLRFVDPHFSVVSWRLVGLLFAAGGLVAFYALAGSAMSTAASVAFAVLFVTDASLLLMTRHDWGPVALNLAFRLTLAGVWIATFAGGLTRRRALVAGGLVGLAIFEKLDAIVLLAPFAIVLAVAPGRSRRTWVAGAIGLLAGAAPLAAANIGSFAAAGQFVSLAGLSEGRAPFSLAAIGQFATNYFAIGAGSEARALIFGDAATATSHAIEAGLLLLLLAAAASRAMRADAGWRARAIVALAGGYLSVGAGLALLPRDTWAHHWVLGAPFQYAAMALAMDRFASAASRDRTRWVVAGLIGALAVTRMPGIVASEQAIASGRGSSRFSPAFTRFAEEAVARADRAAFVAADWGTGTQLYCLSNGQGDFMYEPFSAADPAAQMSAIAASTRKREIYVAVTGFAPQYSGASAAILGFLAASPAWQEVPVDDAFRSLSPIRVRKFLRR